jgi:branched-subunit amino acid transport protein
VSWALLLALAAGAYGFKVLGLVVLGGRTLPARLQRCLALLPAALLSALILVQTFAVGHHLVIDDRAAGVGAAAVAAWLRAPFAVVIVIGAAVTALLRAMM